MYNEEKFWDRIAASYDRIEKSDIAYRLFIEKAGSYLKHSDTILDFGCGTGLICNEISGKVGFIHAVDISTKMVEICNNKALERNIGNIEISRASIFDMKFKAGSFDAIIAFNIFHLLEEPQKYIKRINQLLIPGGLILSATPCMKEAPFLKSVLKFLSFLGITPKLNSFTCFEMEQLFLNTSFKTIEIYRIKPNSPQYLYIGKRP